MGGCCHRWKISKHKQEWEQLFELKDRFDLQRGKYQQFADKVRLKCRGLLKHQSNFKIAFSGKGRGKGGPFKEQSPVPKPHQDLAGQL